MHATRRHKALAEAVAPSAPPNFPPPQEPKKQGHPPKSTKVIGNAEIEELETDVPPAKKSRAGTRTGTAAKQKTPAAHPAKPN